MAGHKKNDILSHGLPHSDLYLCYTNSSWLSISLSKLFRPYIVHLDLSHPLSAPHVFQRKPSKAHPLLYSSLN